MLPNGKSFEQYANGSEMWKDCADLLGIDKTIKILLDYLDINLLRKPSDEERQFCRELFSAMYEGTSNKVEPTKLIYPHCLNIANNRTETAYYYLSRGLNSKCANSISDIINESCYEANRYNFEIATMKAVLEYGFHRVCLVLAFYYYNAASDNRLSVINRRWLDRFIFNIEAFNSTRLRAHATLNDGFCSCLRKLYQDLGAERFVLPGSEERGEINAGFEIRRAIITFDDGKGFCTGYAIGHNPNAVNPWVCWQFAVRNNERDYNWGVYCNDEQTAIDSYVGRIFVAFNSKAGDV